MSYLIRKVIAAEEIIVLLDELGWVFGTTLTINSTALTFVTELSSSSPPHGEANLEARRSFFSSRQRGPSPLGLFYLRVAARSLT